MGRLVFESQAIPQPSRLIGRLGQRFRNSVLGLLFGFEGPKPSLMKDRHFFRAAVRFCSLIFECCFGFSGPAPGCIGPIAQLARARA